MNDKAELQAPGSCLVCWGAGVGTSPLVGDQGSSHCPNTSEDGLFPGSCSSAGLGVQESDFSFPQCKT